VSRIFQALWRVEKANGKATLTPAAKPGELWPDLRDIPGSGTASHLDSNREVPLSASKPGAPDRPRPQILGALAQLESPQTGKIVGHAVERGEQWSDLAARINLLPELVEHAQQVACHPQAAERVLNFGGFPAMAQESFRVLCQRLVQVREQRRLKTVLVTSPVPREGKTVVAINLAATLARSSSAVLLVDADLRHPGLPVLGIAPGRGLADYLAGRLELAQAIRRVDPLSFYYLGAGFASTNPSELLQKPALQEFISKAAAAFDWVIFDSPSINLFADPRHLAMLVDGVLLVVREGVTPKDAAEKSLAALEKAFVVGMVFNASTDSPHAHYDLSEPSHTIDKDETVAAAKPSTERLVGNDSVVPRVSPGQEGPRL
jgi:capsular exopolysaccharide synthesis family protein